MLFGKRINLYLVSLVGKGHYLSRFLRKNSFSIFCIENNNKIKYVTYIKAMSLVFYMIGSI